MEFREFLQLLRKEWVWLLGTIVVVVGGVFAWQSLQPIRYDTVVSLHIAREFDTEQQPSEYRYGDFYRLQADEKFADTVVRWLLSPGIVLDILQGASGDVSQAIQYQDLSEQFQPKRLSSQFIEVRFTTRTSEEGKQIADSMRIVLNREAKSLNLNTVHQDGWFVVVVDDPVTYQGMFNWKITGLFSVIVGILLGVWIVVGRRYLKDDEKER